MKALSLSALAFLLTCSVVSRADGVDDYIKEQMRQQHIPGLSLAVIKDSHLIKVRGYGLANLELHSPARPDTVYQMASVTKQFVATAIMLLVQDGKIGLEDKLSTYLNDSPAAWKEIMVRHLLTHTSGIKDYLNELHEDTLQDTTPEKIVQRVAGLPLNFTPGERWSYSNTGYVLLGMIIQKVSGKTYDAFLAERAFKPLGMTETRRSSLEDIIPERAAGYVWEHGRICNSQYLNPTLWDNGDGGMLSSVLDLARWNAALDGERLLTPSSKQAMWTPVKLANGSTYAYGFGWGVEEVNGHKRISHSGGRPGAAAVIARYPEDRLTVIVLTNGGAANPDTLAQGIARLYVPSLLPRQKEAKVAAHTLASYAGYYNAFGGQTLKITVEKGHLLFWMGDRLLDTFLPVSETRFVSEEAHREFETTKAASGEVTGIHLHMGPREMQIERIGPLASAITGQSMSEPTGALPVETVLKALAQGQKVQEQNQRVTTGLCKDIPGSIPELTGVQSFTFLSAQDSALGSMERHGGKVSRVLYYKAQSGQASRYVLVYLTAQGLITDFDFVAD